MSKRQSAGGVRSEIERVFSLVAMAGVGTAGLGGTALAQTAAVAAAATSTTAADEVEGLVIQAMKEEVANPKQTAEPINQSQTITVVTAATMEAQNLLTLRDILTTVPGITFGAGEGGGGYGDSINIRGFSGSGDIQSDGVRDSAQYTRSDSFNLEQVEVTNGANSATSGAGAVGGTINLVSKQPNGRNSRTVTGGLGTDDYRRLAVDANQMLTDTIAVRLNGILHHNDIPGRDTEKMDRWAVAPSIKFGVGQPTSLALAYLRQRDDNIPQYGLPTVNGAAIQGVNREGYYGSANVDKQLNDVESITSTISHENGDGLSLRNLTRWQRVRQLSIVSPPQGNFCLANGQAPAAYSQTAASTGPGGPVTFNTNISGLTTCASGLAAGFYRPGGPRGTTRDSVNDILFSQADLTWRGQTGPLGHVVNLGLSFSEETYHLDNGNSHRSPNSTASATYADISIANPTPNAVYSGPFNFVRTAFNDNQVRNRAFYILDTITVTPKLLVNASARYEKNEGVATASSITYAGGVGTTTTGVPNRNSANLFSYRAGVTYKPTPNSSLYLAYGSSKTPSQATVNGSCTAATCNVEPETAYNTEIGAKWQWNGLYLTAAVFLNDRANYKVSDPDPLNVSGYQVNEGKARVDGVALGASGRITPKWSVFANYTYLKSRVIQGVSDYQAALGLDYTRGDPLINTPEHAFSLFTSYDLPQRVQVGYGLTYQSKIYLNQHSGITVVCAAPNTCPGRTVRSTLPLQQVDGYTVSRLMVSWQAPRGIHLQLNVQNLFDEDYLTNPRAGLGWANPGAARSATLTASYSF